MRLGIYSLVNWLLTKISRRQDPQPGSRIFWIANGFVAILFGLGHHPATATLAPLH